MQLPVMIVLDAPNVLAANKHRRPIGPANERIT